MSAKGEHERLLSIHAISPSAENGRLYRPVTEDDPATIELADSIREHGILEPLVVSADGYIISGHRRHMAAQVAGLKKVPCRVLDIRRGDGEEANDDFLRLLREHNRHRIKTRDELLREAFITVDPNKAHRALTAYRKRKSKIKVATIEIREAQRRKEISPAKMAFLSTIKRIIFALEEFWPLSLRQIHYQILNEPPLIHSAKPDSCYRNDKRSYAALIDLVTRARHEGYIDYDVIDDPTRPVTISPVQPNLSTYYDQQMKDLLNGYWRDLMQSQPNLIEIVVEKNTLKTIAEPVALEFCIPLTIGRGQCSTRPLYNIAERAKRCGKEKLIILAVSDLDPDGDAIAHSLGQRLRDDFNIQNVEVIKCALTMAQVFKLNLPEKYERAKVDSPNYSRYVEGYNSDSVWELEAVPPKVLQKLLTDAIDGVIDREAFNAEVRQERADAAHNAAVRKIVLRTLREEITSQRRSLTE
jgi:ParB-like nuclease family protein